MIFKMMVFTVLIIGNALSMSSIPSVVEKHTPKSEKVTSKVVVVKKDSADTLPNTLDIIPMPQSLRYLEGTTLLSFGWLTQVEGDLTQSMLLDLIKFAWGEELYSKIKLGMPTKQLASIPMEPFLMVKVAIDQKLKEINLDYYEIKIQNGLQIKGTQSGIF